MINDWYESSFFRKNLICLSKVYTNVYTNRSGDDRSIRTFSDQIEFFCLNLIKEF